MAATFDQFTTNSDHDFATSAQAGQNTNSFTLFGDGVIAITEDNGAPTSGAVATTINNFVVVGSHPGVNDDIITFDVESWGFTGNGSHIYAGLSNSDGQTIEFGPDHFANMFLANSSQTSPMPDVTDVVVYTENGFAGTLTDLKNALQTSGGQVFFGFDPGKGNVFDFLFVYNNAAPNANGANDVSIADIQFEGASSTFHNGTASMDITAAHNLTTLTNITGGAGSLFAEYLAHHSNIFFHT